MNNEKNRIKWVKKCEETLKLGGRSNHTIINYKCAWNKFFKYFPEDIYISKLKDEEIINYFKKEFLDINKASSSYNLNLCAIRFLYSVCFKKELSKILLPNAKIRKRFPVIITKEEFIRIFNLEKNIKHKCWLLLSFCSGLRSFDIANLKIEYIDSKNHKLKVLGKGNKERFTILPDVVIKFLRIYYKRYHISDKEGYLFKGTKNNEHMHTRTITSYFCDLKKDFGISKNITEHSLRHSFATYFLMNNGDLLTLQSMLGHENLVTTSIYIHMAHDFNNLKGINYAK